MGVNIFSSYLMVISGKPEQVPVMMTFEIGSPRLAKEYAIKSSLTIASDKYYDFVLYRQNEDQQELIHSWSVKFKPHVEPANA